MLSTDYLGLKFALVKDPGKMFKEDKGIEMIKVKSIFDASKLLFNINNNTIKLEVSETGNVYKYTIISPDHKKSILGYMYYIPKDRRLDIWAEGEAAPTLQFKVRTAVTKNYSGLLDRVGLENLFARVVNLL